MKPTGPISPTVTTTALWGMFRRRSLWAPTWKAAIVFAVAAVLFLWLVLGNLYGFLAVNDPKGADLIVADGWLPDRSLEAVVKSVTADGGPRLCLTGGPLGAGSRLTSYETYAELAAATVEAMGVSPERLIVAPAPGSRRYRSTMAAQSLRKKLRELGIQPDAIDVYTLGPHSRRTRLIYERVFGDTVDVGVHSIPPCDYGADDWWSSSAGVKDVLMETVAYLYERVRPSPVEGE